MSPIDGAENRTKALVVEDTAFPEPLVVGKHDVGATGLNSRQDPDAIIGPDEDSAILAPFFSTKGNQMLQKLVATGARPSIMSITPGTNSAFRLLNCKLSMIIQLLSTENLPLPTDSGLLRSTSLALIW